jgi:hypothetical protein
MRYKVQALKSSNTFSFHIASHERWDASLLYIGSGGRVFYGRIGGDQIQLSMGHGSIQTTQRYVGVEQDLTDVPCDHLELWAFGLGRSSN